MAPSGDRLFFASTRPEPPGGPDEAFDIWVVDRQGDGWGTPRRLGPQVNSDAYDNYPSAAAGGNLYFASRRGGGHGQLDLYVSRLIDGEYQEAENLGPAVNGPATDADPYIAPDESYLIFASTREGGLGAGDLFIAFNRDGAWTDPIHLGEIVNTADWDYTPLVTPDGDYLFYSRGWGEIYVIEVSALPVEIG